MNLFTLILSRGKINDKKTSIKLQLRTRGGNEKNVNCLLLTMNYRPLLLSVASPVFFQDFRVVHLGSHTHVQISQGVSDKEHEMVVVSFSIKSVNNGIATVLFWSMGL